MTAPQRSLAWFAQRKGRVTASSVGAILGHSPFMTREGVMRAMVREALGAPSEFPDPAPPPVQWGVANEKMAIADFEMDTGLTVVETGFHPFEDWAGCSPDGLIGDDSGLEAKCPYGIRNDIPPQFKTLLEQLHYHDQVQFTMHCLNRPTWHFTQWTPYGNDHTLVHRCPDWAADAMPALKQFHAQFLWEVEHNPAEHLQPLRVTIDTPTAALMVQEYDQLSEAIDNATERRKELLTEMVALSGGKNALFGGRKLTLTQKAGAVSYARVVKDLCPDADLEPYRGKPQEYWGLK